MTGLCTFCDTPLDNSLEHILQSAIGGRKCSRRVICGQHNNNFGGTIDDVLAKQLALYCNLLAIKTGRGETAATIKNLQTVDGQRVDLGPGGKFIGTVKIDDVEVAPGKRQIKISAGSEEELGRLADQYLKKYGKDLSTLENSTIEQRIEPGASIEFSGKIGGEDALRAIAKVALLLLASETGTEAVRGVDTQSVRAFILDGGTTWDVIRHDYDTEFARLREFEALPEYAHRVAAIADPTTGIAVGLVELFGTFRYTVLISESWTGPAVGIHYGIDPTTGESAEAHGSTGAPLTVAMYRARETPEREIGERLKRLFGLMKKRQLSLSIEEIAEQSVASVLTPDRLGTMITAEDVARITQEAVGRFMAVQQRVPYSQKLDPELLKTRATSAPRSGRRGRRKKR